MEKKGPGFRVTLARARGRPSRAIMPNQRTHRRRRRRKNGADPTPPRGPLDDITEDLACLVFTHVDYLRDRRSLSAVSKVGRDRKRLGPSNG